MPYDLVCLGNPLLDLQVSVDDAYLNKYGLKADDAILVEPQHMPIYEEVLNRKDLIFVAGGAAQNTARGAQYILPENSVAYFGCVGNDVYKNKLDEANAKYGLKTFYQVHPTVATGKCAVLISGHNRSLATDLGAANEFNVSHFDDAANWKVVEEASVYYIGGYHLTVSPPAIVKLGKHAAENNKPFAVNLSAPFIPQFFKDPLAEVIPYTDYLIGNESEAAAYGEAHGLGATDVVTVAKHIAKLPKANTARPRTVVFTQGTEETVTVAYNADKDDFDIKKYPVHLLSDEQIADTNGAGDAFAAGFISQIVKKQSLEEAVKVGQWAAKLSIQQIGPSFPFPKQTYSA